MDMRIATGRLRSPLVRLCGYAAMGLLALLAPAGRAPAQTPEKPEEFYWFRNPSGAGPEQGAMDSRIRQIAGAYGAGRYQEARKLAEAVLTGGAKGELAAQAASYLVESYLAEGDFEGARAAAMRLPPADSGLRREILARVKDRQTRYEAEVNRLQRIVATTPDPAEAALAQLWTAHAHQRVGRLDAAEQSYRKVVERYSDAPEAVVAFRQLVLVYAQTRGTGVARQVCVWALEAFPQATLLGRAAVEWLAGPVLGPVADKSSAELDETEALLVRAAASSTDPTVKAAAQAALSDLLFAAGADARSQGDYRLAIRYLERVLSDRDWHGSTVRAARELGDSYQAVGSHADAVRAYELGLAGEPFQQERLPLLFEIGNCKMALGEYEAAIDVFRDVAQHDEVGSLNSECRKAIRKAADALREQPPGRAE